MRKSPIPSRMRRNTEKRFIRKQNGDCYNFLLVLLIRRQLFISLLILFSTCTLMLLSLLVIHFLYFCFTTAPASLINCFVFFSQYKVKKSIVTVNYLIYSTPKAIDNSIRFCHFCIYSDSKHCE